MTRDLIRAYTGEDDARGELNDVRMGLSTDIVWKIHELGMSAEPGSILEHNCAIVELKFLLTWREHSIRSIMPADITLQRDSSDGSTTIVVRPRSLKGCPARGVPPSKLTCDDQTHNNVKVNGLSLQLKYAASVASRPDSLAYWTDPNGNAPAAQVITRALTSALEVLHIEPPPGCYYASHSLRIGSTTALVHLGIPLPVIMQKGSWKSLRMILNVYFDGRIEATKKTWFYFSRLATVIRPPAPASLL